MRAGSKTVLACALGLVLSGCGGQAFNNDLPNLYAGDWSGLFDDRLRPATGTVDWVISDTGVMTGSITRDSDGESGTFTGAIDRTGQFTGSADFTGLADFTNIEGAITRSSTEYTGNFSYTYNGTTTSATFSLTPNVGARP